MPYDEKLAERIRKALAGRDSVSERKMFGGLTFMLGEHMCCGVVKDELVVRLGPQGAEHALRRPHTRPMDFTGRPLKGFVFVKPEGVRTDDAVRRWVEQAASSLPSNSPGAT